MIEAPHSPVRTGANSSLLSVPPKAEGRSGLLLSMQSVASDLELAAIDKCLDSQKTLAVEQLASSSS